MTSMEGYGQEPEATGEVAVRSTGIVGDGEC